LRAVEVTRPPRVTTANGVKRRPGFLAPMHEEIVFLEVRQEFFPEERKRHGRDDERQRDEKRIFKRAGVRWRSGMSLE
jgi:hypothetical protein